MKATRFTKTILIVLGIIGLIALIFYYFQMIYNKNTSRDSIKEKHASEQSQYPGVDIIIDTYEDKTYYKAVHYPKFQQQALNNEINEYVLIREQNFNEQLAAQDGELLKEHPAQFYLTFDIYSVTDQLYSIVFTEENYFGGANSNQSTKVFLVDLKNEQFINQTDIIKDTKENREKIHELLLNAFKQSEKYSSFLNEEYLKAWIEKKENIFSNMFLTDQSIVFKFDKYEVTAGAAGMPEIVLPYNEIIELISAEWVERLNLQGDIHENETTESKNPPDEEEMVTEEAKEEQTNDISPNDKRVAITFDDGPHPKNTLKILDLLKEHEAKATFFMLGSRVDFYPAIAKMVAENGHELGNHTWNHKDLTTLSPESISREVEDTNEIILKVTGQEASVLRPPYGSTNEVIENYIDLPSVLWTVDTLDWKSHDPQEVLKAVKENVEDGSIILMHDIHETTVEALDLVLNYLNKNDYKFVTVSELK